MRRLAIVVAVLLASLAATAGSPAADTPAVTIHAQFISAESATHYTAIVTNVPLGDVPVVVFWKLTLMQIDSNGKVDPPCNKTENGSVSTEFIWHHGNTDGCNHDLEGLHGHQGRITVKIHLKDWDCLATYDGSTGVPPDGPTRLCTPLVEAAKGPCDDEQAAVAQIEAELAALDESHRLLQITITTAYGQVVKADAKYLKSTSDPEYAKAANEWKQATQDWERATKADRKLAIRRLILRAKLKRANAALAACQGSNKRLIAGSAPDERCTAALLAAATAKGRLAGYTEVVGWFRGTKLSTDATLLRTAPGCDREGAGRRRSGVREERCRARRRPAQAGRGSEGVARDRGRPDDVQLGQLAVPQ
jgi:hypothetical protein